MELKTVANPIDQAGATKQVLTNLFNGWGYNFYRKENQLRADDLLIRNKVSELLGQCRAHLAGMESAYRRENLKPPTRENPLPDPSAIANAQALHRMQQDIETVETKIRSAPVPEMDRVNQRHRNEQETLEQLVAADSELVSAAKQLCDNILAQDDATSAAAKDSTLIKSSALGAICERRAQILSALII